MGLVYTAVWQLFLGKGVLSRRCFVLTAFLSSPLVGYIFKSASGASAASGTVNGPLTADPWWGVIAAGAFTASEWFGCPPPLAIVLGALGGLAWYGVVRQ